MSRRLLTCLVSTGIVVLAAAPGLADRAALHDRNDAYGRLDVKTIAHGHGKGGTLVHHIDTFGTWPSRVLKNDGTYIRILFTTDKDNRPERALVVDFRGGRLVADMHSWRNGVGGKVGRARASRPGPRSLRLAFPRRLLGSGISEYGWHVDTQFHDDGHPHCGTDHGVQVVCPDAAPNGTRPNAYLRHEI